MSLGPARPDPRNARALPAWAALAIVAACGEEPQPRAAIESPPWLVDVTEASGVDFVHASGAGGDFVLTEVMGGGGALFDANGDGALDLLLLQGAADPAAQDSPAASGGHRLYLGDGRGGFRDARAGSGFEGLVGYAMSAAVGDLNDDGALDVYLTQHGRDRLLLGRGDGTFDDATEAWGVAVDGWSTAAAIADLDQDGDLDVFVTRYIVLRPGLECRDGTGRETYCPPTSGEPYHDVVLLQEGGRFTDGSEAWGTRGPAAPGLGVVVEDLTGDGRLDVYVANDGAANHLWTLGEDDVWSEDALVRGVALDRNGIAEASMGVITEDLDGDGRPDLFMTHLADETHTLYRGRGPGFADETGSRGLFQSTKPGTGFGVAAVDLETDGDLDLLVAQGRVVHGTRRADAAVEPPWDHFAEPNLLLVNDGRGHFSAREESAWTGPVTVDRALLSGDLDGDGDRDFVATRIDGAALVLRNDAPRVGRIVRVDPREYDGAATTLGAAVQVTWREVGGNGDISFARTTRASDGYLTSRDPRVDVAVPREAEAVEVTVLWPDGARTEFGRQALARESAFDDLVLVRPDASRRRTEEDR